MPGIVSGVPLPVLRQGIKMRTSNNNWEETLVNTIRVLANFPRTTRREFGGQTVDKGPADSG